MKVLVTGGAGYVGIPLSHLLLEAGHEVVVYDNLVWGVDGVLPLFRSPRFTLVEGDVLDAGKLRKAITGADAVIHLAAIVGQPACDKAAAAAYQVNTQGTKNVVDALSPRQIYLFASTGSVYGRIGNICTEDTPLNPQSLYGTTKAEAEKISLNAGGVAYRFPTAFGFAPRLRLDLLPNDFLYQAMWHGFILLYQPGARRTFMHVNDIGRSYLFGLERFEALRGKVYNVGNESLNLTKKELAEIVNEITPFRLYIVEGKEDADQRDYFVDYSRIRGLGFTLTVGIREGLVELERAIRFIRPQGRYRNF